MESEMSTLREALRELVAKLDEIEAHPSFQSIWFDLANHGRPYTGPNYKAELEVARAALAVEHGADQPEGGLTPEQWRQYLQQRKDFERQPEPPALTDREAHEKWVDDAYHEWRRRVLAAQPEPPAAPTYGQLMMALAVIRELTGTQQKDLDATIAAVKAALSAQPTTTRQETP